MTTTPIGSDADALRPSLTLASAQGHWLLAVAVLGSGMAFLDATVVNVALPSIGRDLHASTSELQWVLNGYLLTLASLILLGGSLGDRFGRRRVFVIGAAMFSCASLLCRPAAHDCRADRGPTVAGHRRRASDAGQPRDDRSELLPARPAACDRRVVWDDRRGDSAGPAAGRLSGGSGVVARRLLHQPATRRIRRAVRETCAGNARSVQQRQARCRWRGARVPRPRRLYLCADRSAERRPAGGGGVGRGAARWPRSSRSSPWSD